MVIEYRGHNQSPSGIGSKLAVAMGKEYYRVVQDESVCGFIRRSVFAASIPTYFPPPVVYVPVTFPQLFLGVREQTGC
jgi:hypothetical protein